MPDTESEMAKVAGLIRDIPTCMLVTVDRDGRPHSRPMATQEADFDGTVWFLTDIDSHKVFEVAQRPMVAVTYASPGKESYVSLTGVASLQNDRELVHRFWNAFMKAWWDGPDDPRIRVLRIDVEQAEYWDTPGGKVASLFALAKAAITGKPAHQDNETGKVDF